MVYYKTGDILGGNLFGDGDVTSTIEKTTSHVENPLELFPQKETKQARIISTTIENEKLKEMFNALQIIKQIAIEELKEYLGLEEIIKNEKDNLSYEELKEIREKLKNTVMKPLKKRKCWRDYRALGIIKRMNEYLRFYGIERFLIYFDFEIIKILKELDASTGKTKNKLKISYEEWGAISKKIEEFIKELETKDKKYNLRRNVLSFLRNKKIQKLLIYKESLNYSKNYFLLYDNFHRLVLEISEYNKEEKHPKLKSLLNELTKNGDKNSMGTIVILVSNKDQIKIIQRFLQDNDVNSEIIIEDGNKIEKTLQRIVITTPGEFKKFKHKIESKNTLIYYDSETHQRNADLEIGFDIILQLKSDVDIF